jgi:hypothetical protein
MRHQLTLKIGVVLGIVLMAGSASAVTSALHEWTDVVQFGFGNNGYVSEGNSLGYAHIFEDPRVAAGQTVHVTNVRLSILLSEDVTCENWVECRYDWDSQDEWAVIEVNNNEIFSGGFPDSEWELVVSDVSLFASISTYGDYFVVTIESRSASDFQTLISAAEFYYTVDVPIASESPTNGPAVPEPSSAVVFGVGLLVLSRRFRS